MTLRDEIDREIKDEQATIDSLKEQSKEVNEALDEKTKALEEVKRTAAKAAKNFDKVLKDIASMVSAIYL